MSAEKNLRHVSETPATQWLRQQGVEYTEHVYEYVEHGGTGVSSQALGVPEHQVVKTLVMEDENAKPLARTFHQVAPVYGPFSSQNPDCDGASPEAKLERRGYAGLRGACAALLRSSARRCHWASDCAPLAQHRSHLHPRNSRVPDEMSGLIVLMHGDRKVSTKNLARQTDRKRIAPCAPEVAQRHSGYQVGGTSPFGLRKPMPVFVERTVLALPRIYINGGRRGYLVGLNPIVLTDVLKAQAVDVALALVE